MTTLRSAKLRLLAVLFVMCGPAAFAQRVALIEPDPAVRVEHFADAVRRGLAGNVKVLDAELADAAFRSTAVENVFNLSTQESKRIGAVVGCDAFVLLGSATQRRESLDRPAYIEAYGVAYVVDSRSGTLIEWMIESVEAATPAAAAEKLLARAPAVAAKIAVSVKAKRNIPPPVFDEVPEPDSPAARGLRTPIPYRRIRPEYTRLAYLYGVKATVDIEVDIDAEGRIVRTSIERWAGFGLDAAVDKAVRSMNWRPAERDGKVLPMRVLLRYNFTKTDKDEAF